MCKGWLAAKAHRVEKIRKNYVAVTFNGTGQADLQATANHTVDRIVATSAHADDLDAGVASCNHTNYRAEGEHCAGRWRSKCTLHLATSRQ